MRRTLVSIAAVALVAVPTAAQGAEGRPIRVGTADCYVEVYPPAMEVTSQPPFVVFHPTGDPGPSAHCPI
jgi:hypothetical protein